MKKLQYLVLCVLALSTSITYAKTTALQHQIQASTEATADRLSKEIGKEIVMNMQRPNDMSVSDFRKEKKEAKTNIEATLKGLKGNSRQVKIQKIILEDYLVNLSV